MGYCSIFCPECSFTFTDPVQNRLKLAKRNRKFWLKICLHLLDTECVLNSKWKRKQFGIMAAPFFWGGAQQVVHEHMPSCKSSVAQTRNSFLKHFQQTFVSRRSAVIEPFCFDIVKLKNCFQCGPLQKKQPYLTSITRNSINWQTWGRRCAHFAPPSPTVLRFTGI